MAVQSPRACCYQSLQWIPVLFILAVIAWSYYAYVIEMCIGKFRIENFVEKYYLNYFSINRQYTEKR
jgi:palmitoyltransferase